jgi:hypothetical protein
MYMRTCKTCKGSKICGHANRYSHCFGVLLNSRILFKITRKSFLSHVLMCLKKFNPKCRFTKFIPGDDRDGSERGPGDLGDEAGVTRDDVVERLEKNFKQLW